MNLVRNLNPVTFNWKEDGRPDFGLVAEDVEVEPLLITHNDVGEIEGVKYDRVGVVLVNAVKEQQLEIESEQKEIEEQKEIIRREHDEIEELKQLLCSQNASAGVCRQRD
jgi:endosialidase-like protein